MKVVALAGGVGGAKLADGLYRTLTADSLTVIVNCGDDFAPFGLRVCPDLDTVCYTLAGLANPQTGWGRQGETWVAYEEIRRLGGPAWFHLGDQDLATHLERTRRLQSGETLSRVTRDFCQAWGITARVLPMTDDWMPTWVDTVDNGWLPFQEYFVKLACEPKVKGFEFRGAQEARPAPGVIESIRDADCVVICPSNPWVSIGPILSVPGVMEALKKCPVRVVISPIVGGKAIKGPAAKMFTELGIQPSCLAVAQHYQDWCTHFIMDREDSHFSEKIEALGMSVTVTDTMMYDSEDRIRLARETLEVCSRSIKKDKSG